MFSDLLNDPTVKFMLMALLLAAGGYLTSLFRRLTKKLDFIAEETQVVKSDVKAITNDVKEVAKTTTETVTLVDGQLSDVKAQLKEMMGKWEGTLSDLAKEKEEAVQVSAKALQVFKEQAEKDRSVANEHIANLTHQLTERVPNHVSTPEPAAENLVAIIPEAVVPVVEEAAQVPPKPKRPPRVRVRKKT